MSYSEALARAQQLKTSLLDHGVKTVSIEIQQGRPGTPNDLWWDGRFIGALMHHTVSKPSNGDTPCLWLVKEGRSDVPGPLCNGYGGYDEVARIICMGWANHPGEGGPLSFPGGTIPKDQGRPYLFGWEMEGGIEQWTESMHTFMARCAAGTLDWLGRDTKSQGEHKTWAPTRKIDRLGYTTESGRQRTADHWNDGSTSQEDELKPDEREALLDVLSLLKSAVGQGQRDFPGTIAAILGNVQNTFNRVGESITATNGVKEVLDLVKASIDEAMAGLPPGAGTEEIADAVVKKMGDKLVL